MSVRKQDRNGVKVRVHEHPTGTWVDATCQCFGSPQRVHSNPDCPVRLAAIREVEANTCPGCWATDCTPDTCPAYAEWHREDQR